MNQTNTDYLFQVIPTGGDRATGAPRPSGSSSGFNDHLSQASTSVFDVVRQAPKDPPSRPSRSNDSSSSTQRDSRSSSSNSKPNDSASSCNDTCSNVGSSRDDVDDRSDVDETDSDDAAEVAAGQSAASESAKDSANAKRDDKEQDGAGSGDGDKIEKTVAAKSAKEVHREAAAAEANRHLAESQKNDAPANAADDSAADATVATDEVSTAAAEEKSGKQSRRAKSQAGDGENAVGGEGHANGKQATVAKPATAVSLDNSAATGEAKAAAKEEATKASDKSEATDADATSDAKGANRANNRNDAVSATNKTDGATVANVTASATAAAENDPSKNSDDRATKAIGTKSETAVGPLGRALQSATEITRGGRSNGQPEMPPVDPARFVNRVAKAFNTAQERGGTVHLRLSPPELGAMKIQLTVQDGVMNASLETDNSNARRLLLDHLPALRDRLAEQNIRVDRFDVDVRQENTGGQANANGSSQNPYQQQQPEQTGTRRQTAQPQSLQPATVDAPAGVSRISNTEINLVV